MSQDPEFKLPHSALRFKNQSILSISQFKKSDFLDLFATADACHSLVQTKGIGKCLNNKLISLLFFEPSTRTNFSFQSAALRLGAQILNLSDISSSSIQKGETLQDTIKCLSSYSDLIIQRHSQKGSARIAAEVSGVPLINAGDGVGEHPTQAILDLYTIQNECAKIDELTICFVGDLRNGRTVHSLAKALSLFSVKLIYVSPTELQMPEEIKKEISGKTEQIETVSLENVLSEVDVLYVTRVQKERFESEEKYNTLKDSYIITPELLGKYKSKTNLKILHPLPRVNEISVEVDKITEKACYFRQMKNGMFVRMALLAWIFGVDIQ